MPAGGGLTGRTIADGRIRTTTSASIVAVIRGEDGNPGPGPDFLLQAGDTVLVMGSDAAVRQATAILVG
ncbi:cation:proton antiporter regulatory subunit [Demequina litorisediminis]|uniref:RCK C-terminal domain-containing protein n=1 Tax=Demequina litorisediminis TaxID=1849022 RepID=A0ABQ6ICX2_9MICO|nr:TrkA C-terminal domain-containing protein [Demequina litorisediminis]GMA35531.1 hypothetical protein GCM10025876_17350 [Demequina litorisediminis]